MEGRNYVFFRNDDNSAYMNMASNFRGVNHGTENKIDVYFTSASNNDSYDKIILSVADEKEKEACDAIAACLAGSKFDAMRVVADDVAKVYVDSNITAVDSITVESQGTMEPAAIVSALDRTMTTAESGSTVLVNHAAKVITLPTVAEGLTAGMNFTVIPLIDPEAGWTVVAAEGIYGHLTVISATEGQSVSQEVLRSAAVGAPGTYDNFDLVHDTNTLGGTAGQIFKFVFDGTAWFVDAPHIFNDHANPASIAIINAG